MEKWFTKVKLGNCFLSNYIIYPESGVIKNCCRYILRGCFLAAASVHSSCRYIPDCRIH